MIRFLLFCLIYLIFWGLKGVKIKGFGILFEIMTFFFWYLSYVVALGFSGWFEFFIRIYLLYSIFDYFFEIDLNNKIKIFSLVKVKVKKEGVLIRYTFFRPIMIFFINIYLLFKKSKDFLNFNDAMTIEVDTEDVEVAIII